MTKDKDQKRKAVFLDRDGVVLQATPRGIYLLRWADAHYVRNIEAVAKALKRGGFLLPVVTNQAQVGRGLMARDALAEIHFNLEVAIPELDRFFVCLHTNDDNCDCRKPKPGLLQQAAEHYNIDATQSWMVGDSWRDVDAGNAFGCRTIFVRNEFNSGEEQRCQPTVIVKSISEVPEVILGA